MVKFRKSRRTTKKRGFWGKAMGHLGGFSSTAAMAGAALKAAWKLKKLINVEFKVHDISNAGNNIVNTGTINNLTNIASGDDMTDREGRSILLKSWQVRGQLRINVSAVASTARLILFLDRDYLGALPAVTDVLASADINSPLNILTQAGTRYKILMDKQYSVSNQGHQIINIKKYMRLHTHTRYKALTAADASGLRGQLLWLFIGNEATNYPTLTAMHRIRYIDN